MHAFFAILANDVRLFFRDRVAYVELFGLPFIAIVIAGFALGGLGNVNVKLGIAGGGKGEVSQRVIAGLEELQAMSLTRFATEDDGVAALRRGEVYAVLAFPPDFDERVSAGDRSKMVFWSDESRKSINDVVSHVMSGTAMQISGISVATQAGVDAAIDAGSKTPLESLITSERARAERLWKKPPVELELRPLGGSSARNNPFNQQVPGYTIMFLLFNCVTYAAKSLLDERANKTLLRLYCAPLSRMGLLAGKVSAFFLKGLIQVWILLTLGRVLFGMHWGDSVPALFLLTLALTLGATGIGLVLAVSARTPAQANFVGLMMAIGMSALGGSWWPLEIEPVAMQKLAYLLTINAWGMDAFATLLWRGGGLVAIVPHMAVLCGVFVVGAAIAATRFKLERLAE